MSNDLYNDNDNEFIDWESFENDNIVANLNRSGAGRYNLRANPRMAERMSDYEI